MIYILYNKTHSYVPSVHPLLFRELQKHQSYDFQLLDVGTHTLSQIKQQLSGADLLVIDQSVLNALDFASKNEGGNITYMHIPHLKEKEFYVSLLKFLMDVKMPALHWFSITDPHGVLTVDLKKINHAQIETEVYLQRICGIMWGYRSDKLIDFSNIPPPYYENWFEKSENPAESYQIIKQHITYDIEVVHCINKKEFCKAEKKWDIDVPGAQYGTRRIVQDILNRESFTRPTKKELFLVGKINGLINKTGFLPSTLIFKNNFLAMRYYIARCRISFVCGSGLRYLVRKFLEVPAFESVMLAYPPVNMSDYGFIDGVHYIHTYPEEIKDKLEFILADKEKQAAITTAAKTLVSEKHTDAVRATQLIKALRLVAKGQITKAYFDSGEYCYFNGSQKVEETNG